MERATYLADTDINALALAGHPLVVPFDSSDVRPASVDLHLSGERLEYGFNKYRLGDDITESDFAKTIFEELEIAPQDTVHVGLAGKIVIPPDSLGWVFARSSLTRLGLRIAPVFMNPGYSGSLPITITNATSFSVTLVKGIRVAQLVCARLANTPAQHYSTAEGKYMDEQVAPSRIHSDADIKAAMARVLKGYFPETLVKTVV